MRTISISDMSIEEKISTMEMIWEDLCRHHNVPTPDWHQKVLQTREEKLLSGHEQPMDWSEAKKHILNNTR